MRFEFCFLETHHSTIPLFHYSNWGKVPKFQSQGNILQFLSVVTSKKRCNRSVKIVITGHRTDEFQHSGNYPGTIFAFFSISLDTKNNIF